MKKFILRFLLFFTISLSSAQVGSNTTNPSATLDIVSGSNSSFPDGIMVPRLTRGELIAKVAAYTANQTGAMVYITKIDGIANSTTTNVLEIGYYYFNGISWQSFNASTIVGEIRYAVVSSDFDGWVKLDGRAITTLTPNQQFAAQSLGFTSSLPNLTDGYFSQTSASLGSVQYANAKLISRANLPNVDITTSSVNNHSHTVDFTSVSTSTNGAHTHANSSSSAPGQYGFLTRSSFGSNETINAFSFDAVGSGSEPDVISTPTALIINDSGNHNHTVDIPLTTGTIDSAHSHTFSLNGGVTQIGFDVRPATLSTNVFVYLGQ